MSDAAAIEHWPTALEEVARSCSHWKRVTVLRETDSTQDAARRLGARAGDVITAWRQTAGRGRLGRVWADTGEQGVAVTFVIEPQEPERLAIASALGTAYAIEKALGRRVGIKWPNDIVVNGRKLAGILVEQVEQIALIGVGINVCQESWPADLENRAVSLRQLGAAADRIKVLASLLPMMDGALRMPSEELVTMFHDRDALLGTTATFRSGDRTVHGCVVRVDPLRGIEIITADGAPTHFPAATTTVVAIDRRDEDALHARSSATV